MTAWKEGDRVIGGGGTPPPGLEAPLRRQEQYNYRLEGFTDTRKRGYAEYTLLNDWAPLGIPDNVTDLHASLTEPCSVAVRAVRLSNMKLGDVVAVLGAGHTLSSFLRRIQKVVDELGGIDCRLLQRTAALAINCVHSLYGVLNHLEV